MLHPTIMINRNVTGKIQYETDLDGAEDYALYLKLGLRHLFYNLPKILLKFRVHRDAVTYSQIKNVQSKTILAQKRAFSEYGYPLFMLPYLLYGITSNLVPIPVKKYIYNLLKLK